MTYNKPDTDNTIVLTAMAGVIAAILVGIGEYLLHFDAQARFADGGYGFMLGISDSRSTLGHFFGVFGACLYPVGCYHIQQMLKPANSRWSFAAFLIGSMGFMVGVVWIGSRASISAIAQLPPTPELQHLTQLYELRYESLLQVIRLTTLFISVVFVWLTVSGRSYYPRWMAIFNPIVLIIASFLIYLINPGIGKHLMPIALNVAFLVFFSLSLLVAVTRKRDNTIT